MTCGMVLRLHGAEKKPHLWSIRTSHHSVAYHTSPTRTVETIPSHIPVVAAPPFVAKPRCARRRPDTPRKIAGIPAKGPKHSSSPMIPRINDQVPAAFENL